MSDSLLVIRQAYSITRLYVILRFFEAGVNHMLSGPPMDTRKEALANELTAQWLSESVSTKLVNVAMIEQWVSEVICEHEQTRKAASSEECKP